MVQRKEHENPKLEGVSQNASSLLIKTTTKVITQGRVLDSPSLFISGIYQQTGKVTVSLLQPT